MNQERRDQARAEIARHRQFLDAVGPAQDFASEISMNQIQGRISELENDIRGTAPRLDVVLQGETADAHRVPAEMLARLVGRLQQGITRIGWALHAGPADERTPPIPITRATTFDVVALSPSSFRVVLQQPMSDLTTEQLELDYEPDLAETAVDTLFNLLSDAEAHSLDEDSEALAHSIGSGSAKSIQALMSNVADSGMTARFDWKSNDERRAHVTPETASYLRDWLRSVEEHTRHIEVEGVLHGGDDLDGRFRIVDAAGNEYEGRTDPDIVAGKTLRRRYRATIEEVTSVSPNVGSKRERYTLRSLSELDVDDND